MSAKFLINAQRNGFATFANMYRVHLEGTPVSAFAEMSAVQTDLQIFAIGKLLIRSLSLAVPECGSEFSIRVRFRARTRANKAGLTGRREGYWKLRVIDVRS